MKIYILRGISGSGKSTWAKKKAQEDPEGTVICSADNYFYDKKGNYNFDPSKLSDAHNSCFQKFVLSVPQNFTIIVDNTNTKLWEMSPYVSFANLYNAEIEFVYFDCDCSVAAKRNKHGVPERTVNQMAVRMEKLLPFWGKETILNTEEV